MYALDASDPRKRDIAQSLLEDPSIHRVISTQVMIETYSAATRKLSIPASVAAELLRELSALEVVPTSAPFVTKAADTSIHHQMSIWDALIIEAASAALCTELITEDLADGSMIRGVRIRNPFAT